MRTLGVVVLAAAACGGESGGVDAEPSVARCDPERPFGSPNPILEINTATDAEWTPFLAGDELTLYFVSNRPGGVGDRDVYVTTRSTPTAAWSPPSLVPNINSPEGATTPTLTADQLMLYASRGGSLLVTTRSSTSTTFSALSDLSVPGHQAIAWDEDPFVVPDRGALYFTYAINLGEAPRIQRAAINGNALAPPVEVQGLAAGPQDWDVKPVLSSNELTLYFASRRPGGSGGFDIYVANRASTAESFGVPRNVPELNSDLDELPGWVSDDGCVLYLHRDRPAPVQGDLLVALKPM